ncbi:hypothetical protein [Litoribacter populi]|uniref:hypothetical protein n=1 Tax=Litoribacter populi TaxID=2598460 RepID=UPI00117F9671|nr:hypothetical protein [Litoribacter populi]
MAENSVRSGRDGEKIANEILKLIGWGSASWNIDIDCAFPTRHKPTVKSNPHHGIDILYSYDNPLYHDRRDIIIGSVKHSENGYPSSKGSELTKNINELAVNLDCTKQSDNIIQLVGNSKLQTHFKGLLFCLSSLDSEKEYDLAQHTNNNIDFGTNKFEEIFLVDNKRATFLISSIKTAENYLPLSEVKFLYQNTGKNMEKSQLLLSGERLPIQFINSEIIPIVKEEKDTGRISCLIFCNNPYSKENASRLIWLSHKLCGLTNEIRIYFPNYDNNKEYEVNAVKQLYKDETFTTKITFHRFNKFDLISLKETQSKTPFTKSIQDKQVELTHSTKISDDIDKILPYGDILIPKLRTSILSEVNLHVFLNRKGIITAKKNKNDILPLFSCLLLSPDELDSLKATYREKEDKPKEIERIATVNLGSKSLWETFNEFFPILKSVNNSGLPKSCNLVGNPILARVNSDYNHLILKYKIEKENTNKDFLTGKTFHDALMEIKYENNQIIFIDQHTSSETYKLNKNYFDGFKKALKKENLLIEEFKSIQFLDFTNNERVQFLLSFLTLQSSKEINIKNITLDSMKFRADDTISGLPKDLESLKGRVSNLNLNGKELHDTIYLSDGGYRSAILCEKVRFNISYKYFNRNGICSIEVAFSGALGAKGYKDTELRISITPAPSSFDTNFKSTKALIKKEINIIRDKNYAKYKQKPGVNDTI